MKIIVPLVFLLLSFGFWLAIDQKAELGRLPSDDEVIQTQERNKVTGELLNVQIVRCLLCGQVLSYIQSNLRGKVVYAYVYTHHCGQYSQSARYNGSGVMSPSLNIIQWLEKWQRRLSFRARR